MKLTVPNRQRLLLIVAGAGLLLLVLDRIVFTPLGGLWEAHRAELARLQTQVADGRSLVARAGRLNELWSAMRSASLPHDPAQSEHDLIAAFETWSRTSGVELGSVKPQWKAGPDDDTSVLECRLDATGSLGDLTRFVYELESAPQALRVESAEFTARDEAGQSLTLSLVVTGLRLAPLEESK